LVGLVLACCCACAGPGNSANRIDNGAAVSSVYLISHGWHTGVAIRKVDIPDPLWPERRDFPDAEFLEVGWGDRDFYQSPAFSLALAIQAALASNASVLHIVGFEGPVTRRFPGSEIIELGLSAQGLEALARYLHDTFARDGSDAVASLGPGAYADSQYYPARGSFSLFNTCNTWTANALRAAGYAISPANTADPVMKQARGFGKVIQPPSDR
jgi:uncharacterized protein (TIGR02117 family)